MSNDLAETTAGSGGADSAADVSVVVIGASGDLALTKIIPALLVLRCRGVLPDHTNVFGFARTKFSDDDFREKVEPYLAPPPAAGCDFEACKSDFLKRCYYMPGQYDSHESLNELHQLMKKVERKGDVRRLFYLAIPPFVFLDVTRAMGAAGMVKSGGDDSWPRVVIEKPFGSDRETSDVMVRELSKVFRENQTYRIDHYLGKEVIQNLMVLRFANLVFEPIWSNLYIDAVQISWREDTGIGSTGGYFDHYGIIRDVMQNHLLQMLALITMEQPSDIERYVRDEKLKVLRDVAPVTLDNLALGQYASGSVEGGIHPAYLEEDKVAQDSKTPTYAAAVLHVQNRRWEGVPFLLRAGKGMDERGAEISIQFRRVPGNIFTKKREVTCPPNELVIRVQPDEGIFFRIMNKVPGFKMKLNPTDLDLSYAQAFDATIPKAYESLLVDVMRGDESLFIREDELQASWDIFTPVLHEIEEKGVAPELYAFGSPGPENAVRLAYKYGCIWRRNTSSGMRKSQPS